MVIIQPLTVEAFWKLAQQSDYQDKQLELINGAARIVAPSSISESAVGWKISLIVGNYVIEHQLGIMTTANGGFILGDSSVIVPDVAYISMERLPERDYTFFPGAPDLAIEVISANETRQGILDRTRRYLEAGTKVVWNVYPEDRTVDAVSLLEDFRLRTITFTADDLITIEQVLPDFGAPVNRFFEVQTP